MHTAPTSAFSQQTEDDHARLVQESMDEKAAAEKVTVVDMETVCDDRIQHSHNLV